MRRSSRPTAGSGRRGRLALTKSAEPAPEPTTTSLALGDLSPREILTPASVDELATMLRERNERGEAVVAVGGATLQGLGHAPRRYDVALRTAKLNHVLEYEFRDLTVAVEAGVTVADLDAILAERGQFVPLDAPQATRSTVGGVLASGWLGPRRASYGRPRDLVIGMTVVLADGTIAKAGGMVVKNSTGYDLSRLYCGSLGTLAVIVRANFKTLPLREARRVALASLPERTRKRVLEHVRALEIEPVAAFAIDGFREDVDGRDGADGRIFLLFEGSRALVERATRDIRSALGAAGVPETILVDAGAGQTFARLVNAYTVRIGDRSATYRIRGLPSDLFTRSEMLAHLARTHALHLERIEDMRTGDVIARLSAPVSGQLEERILAFDAALHAATPRAHVLSAPESLRGKLAMWGTPPASLDVMRELKTRFDPKGTLAPGRFVGGI
jgi:glycolate oxidase FAD binding subunit